MAKAIGPQVGRSFLIEGHTDNIGGERYNGELARRRADAVRAALEGDCAGAVRRPEISPGSATPPRGLAGDAVALAGLLPEAEFGAGAAATC